MSGMLMRAGERVFIAPVVYEGYGRTKPFVVVRAFDLEVFGDQANFALTKPGGRLLHDVYTTLSLQRRPGCEPLNRDLSPKSILMTINTTAQLLREAKHVVVFSGAGASAESGIPTFRDALSGLWGGHFDSAQLATPEAFRKDPSLCWGWYE